MFNDLSGLWEIGESYEISASYLHSFTSNAASSYDNRVSSISQVNPTDNSGGAPTVSWNFSSINLSVSVFEAA